MHCLVIFIIWQDIQKDCFENWYKLYMSYWKSEMDQLSYIHRWIYDNAVQCATMDALNVNIQLNCRTIYNKVPVNLYNSRATYNKVPVNLYNSRATYNKVPINLYDSSAIYNKEPLNLYDSCAINNKSCQSLRLSRNQ